MCSSDLLRGNQRSRTIESIVAEVKNLAAEGVQEVILISQITTNYGLDIYGEVKLVELFQALGEVDIPWIRMHYAYPTGLTPKVISIMRETPNVLPYLDLPLQHSHPEVLRSMNRPWQGRPQHRSRQRFFYTLNDTIVNTTLPGSIHRSQNFRVRVLQRQIKIGQDIRRFAHD